MPTYEYACQSCGTHLEVFQRFSEDSLTECPKCGGPLRKVFHPAGILFKGSGFYQTDSRSSVGAGSKGASGGEGGSGSATGSGSDSGSGSKSGAGAGSSSGEGS